MWFKRYFLLVLFFVCSCTTLHKEETPQIAEPTQPQKSAYFVMAPITKRSSIQAPCLDICIEDKTFSVELDLGYRGNLTCTKQYVDAIASKNFLRKKPMYGIRGKEYSTKLYQIPELKIEKMTFFKPILQEESDEFIRDATFVQNDEDPSPRDRNRLGWELFYNVNLLVDIKSSLIAFCDGLETLKQQGYEVENFISTPLFLEQGLIEVDTETPKGTLRCVLDTGATFNIINNKVKEEQSLNEALWDTDNLLNYPSFKINGKNFGSITFHQIPINLPIQIDAILGMEFFEENIVFLNFSKKTAYFYKPRID